MPWCLLYVSLPSFITISCQDRLIIPADCISNGAGDGCCSGYCAATKCRPKYERWPSCEEDLVVGEEDEDCCYDHKNKCVEGLCRRA